MFKSIFTSEEYVNYIKLGSNIHRKRQGYGCALNLDQRLYWYISI